MAKSPMTKSAVTDDDDGTAIEEITQPAVRRALPKHLATYDIQPEGIKWGRWAVVAHPDHTINDVLAPGYLFTKGEQFQPCDYVEIKHPLGYFCVCLDVVRVDMQARGLVAHIRHIFDYTKAVDLVQPKLDGVKIERLGSSEWTILDGQHVVADNFPTRAAAEKWLDDRRVA